MTSTEFALQAVAARYAAGIDRRDPELLRSAFHPKARLAIPAMDVVMEGHDQLPGVLQPLSQFEKTFHFLGNTRYDIDGDTATGEVYCLAHHLKGGQILVSAIRYQDTYSRRDGEWRLDDRTVIIDWNHTAATVAWS